MEKGKGKKHEQMAAAMGCQVRDNGIGYLATSV